MKRFILSSLVALTVLFGSGLAAVPAYASSTDAARNQVCTGVKGAGGGSCGAGAADINGVIKGVLQVLAVIAGVAAVIMIIISGMRYITSGGDAQAVSGAKRSLIYAIVGLIVVAMAQFIVHFVLKNTK